MASNANIISQKFYNSYRNGTAFNLNLTEFTTYLQGNIGDRMKLIETINFDVTVNPNESIFINYEATTDPTYGVLSTNSLNFVSEGLWNGAVVDIFVDSLVISGVTIGIISGVNNTRLNIEKALLTAAGIADGERGDFVIKLSTAPKYLNYKYGLNPLDLNVVNYKSPFDTNKQSYYAFGISTTPTFTDMIWNGREQGVNLGSVKVKFDATTGYEHSYTIEHIFKIPWYLEGEQNNLSGQKPPLRLQGNNSLKYANGFFFGGTTSEIGVVYEDLGNYGSVGYAGENFAGRKDPYSISDILITNPSLTGKIEVTETNTVTYKISSDTATGLNPGDKVVIMHSKLPTENEYKNKEEAFDDIWLVEYLEQLADDPVVSGTIIQNLTVVTNLGKLEVEFEIVYTAAQQDLMPEGASVFLAYDIATENLADPNLVDRTKGAIISEEVEKIPFVKQLITSWTPKVYEHWDFSAGAKFFTNFDGYNGDLIGMTFTFRTDATLSTTIKGMNLFIVEYNGTSHFRMSTPIAFASINVIQTAPNPYVYQLMNNTIGASFNIPSTDDLGVITLNSEVPAPSTTTQSWNGSVAVRVPWQGWIENLSVPLTFYDNNEPNSNKNQKTSNYSGVSGYTTRLMLSVSVGSLVNGVEVVTPYQLFTDGSSTLDFNDPGAGTFSHIYKLYDTNGDPVSDIDSDFDTQVDIEFPHALGVIVKTEIWGRIWIEEKNGTAQPWELSTHKDFSNANNWLTPTNTITSSNIQFVEVISVNNLVTLRCSINHNFIDDEVKYTIYGRLGNTL